MIASLLPSRYTGVMRRLVVAALFMASSAACAGSAPPAVRAAEPVRAGPPPPTGPTRTDFKTMAKSLVSRCIRGGWVQRWRAEHPDPDVARPKILLTAFADETGQDLDADYLRRTLEQRMRLSGVYEMVSEEADADFFAEGRSGAVIDGRAEGGVGEG